MKNVHAYLYITSMNTAPREAADRSTTHGHRYMDTYIYIYIYIYVC
jgi:hypothetical protein